MKAVFKVTTCSHLLFLDDIDASLDVGEGMHGGEDGLPLVLLVEFTPGAPALGEWRGVHETPQVEVLLKVCHPVFHLVVIEEGLHVGDLDVCLVRSGGVYRLILATQQTYILKMHFLCVYFKSVFVPAYI